MLAALFSLTATGLYTSYIIPIFLRVTVARHTFRPAEFNLGIYSVPIGWFSVFWGLFMLFILCLPSVYPISINNFNYSPIILGLILIYAITVWFCSAKYWFKGALPVLVISDSEQPAQVNENTQLMNGSNSKSENSRIRYND